MKGTVCLTVFLLFATVNPCIAVSVSGVPEWLEGAVTRSITAVWSEIPDDGFTDREATLKAVSERLFAGYNVQVEAGRYEPVIFLSADAEFVPPEVRIIFPEIRGMALEWFRNDVNSLADEVSTEASQVPQISLTWADGALRERTAEILKTKLPDWDFTQQIFITSGSTVINLSFRPSAKMILAVKPSLYSRTVPAMFRSDLEAKLIPALSPLIGLPVKWAEKHHKDIEKFAREFLEDRHTVENLKANVSVKFKAGKVSELDAGVDSKNFMFSMWVAAYAGLEGRYPEAGAFFGFRPLWRAGGKYNFAPEVYAELIFTLDDFGFTYRAGGRFELFSHFWAGVELQWPENDYYLRFEYIPMRVRRPYARWRWSPEMGENEVILGYRFDEHVSVEIYYNDDIGLKGIWNL